MNKQEERKYRISLTIAVSLYIFSILLITSLFSLLGVILLVNYDLIKTTDSGLTNYKHVLNFMITINIIIGLCITSFTSQSALKYINRIINQMNRLASGDFKARLSFGKPMSKHPTVIEITDSFNRMAEELDNTQMLRSDFINNFSHEFKTPIVSIAGFAKLLKRGNLTEEQRQEYYEIIEQEAMRLSAMATNVLNMTKVENQTILTDVTSFNLSEQIRASVLLLESKWNIKNINFNLEFDEYNIDANEELLKQVWINLLDNAIKFSDEYSEIDIKIIDNIESYEISITNSGEIIPADSLNKIFNKFYQCDESHSSEGNGIGLSIVKKVIELHNGRVCVKSENGLTTFIVNIPKSLN